MGFKAAEVVETLDYDFGQYGPKGVTPEPSNNQIQQYQRSVKDIMGPLAIQQAERDEAGGGPATIEEIKEALSTTRDQLESQILDGMIEATALLCSNKPNKEEITALPGRLQQHYVGYIAGLFLRGEASTPATRP